MKTIILLIAIIALTTCQQKCDCQPNKGDTQGLDAKKACAAPTIANCEVAKASDNSKCESCKADHFYDDFITITKCTAVPTADLIKDCKLYDEDKTCVKCVSGKTLGSSDNKCGAAITNCFSHSGESTALKCEKCDYGFKVNAGKTACDAATIENCIVYDIITGNGDQCTLCKSDYYVSSGKCSKRTSVANCSSYTNDKDECIDCNIGYVISADKKTCEKLTISKCVGSSTTKDKCNFCDGIAPKADLSECSVAVTDVDANCAGYGVDKKCAACKPGYGIDATNKCTNKCPASSGGNGTSNSQIIAFSMILLTFIALVL